MPGTVYRLHGAVTKRMSPVGFLPNFGAARTLRRQRRKEHPICCAGAMASSRTRAPPLLRVESVYYRVPMDYDKVVFDTLDFKVHAGEMVLVTGQNGSGKTTGM